MKGRQLLSVLFAFMLLISIGGCGSSGGGSSDSSSDGSDAGDDSASSSIDKSLYAESVAESEATYDEADIVGNTDFDYTIYIDFSANTARLSSGTAQTITDSGGVDLMAGLNVAKTTYGITVTSSIDAAICYSLSGTLSGTFTLSSSSASDYPYQLYLDGATISGSSGPALDLESTQKVFIVSASGTTSRLTDSSTRNMTMKAALYGEGPMVFSGEGNLSVTGSYKHGIYSDDYIRVCGGTLNVAVSAKNAVQSVNGFIFDDGDLTIAATGTTTDDESKGIKVDGDDDTTNGAGKGYIVINGGYITVTSVGKAITAAWDIDEDLGDNESGNPDPYVEINNGVIDITTTGTPYETATASCSPEGIEGKAGLTINDGYLTINTTEDSLNTSNGSITINGGYLYCKSGTDAIDSNGTLTINGGVIVAIGASTPEGPFDCDASTFTINGGTIVGIGGAISQPSAAGGQNVVVLGSITSGRTMALKAGDGTIAFAFTVPQAYTTMLISSPDILTGTSYTVYTGGTASADNDFYGLYLDSLGYSGGSGGTSFTVSSVISKIGGADYSHN